MSDNIPTVCRIGAGVVAAELYIQCPDDTVDWYPSIHTGVFDAAIIEEQIRAHNDDRLST